MSAIAGVFDKPPDMGRCYKALPMVQPFWRCAKRQRVYAAAQLLQLFCRVFRRVIFLVHFHIFLSGDHGAKPCRVGYLKCVQQ